MRILFTRFPLESRFGGAEVQTLSLMQGLQRRGHEVTFLGDCPTLLELCRRNGVPCRRIEIGVPPVTKWLAVSFLWRQFGMRRKLREEFENFKDCHAVCMLSLSEKILLTPIALEANAKVLWIEHDTVGRWLRKNPWLPRLLRLSRRVTTVGVSKLSRGLYVKMGWEPDRVVVIPNGIEIGHWPLEAQAALRDREGFRVGTVARLSPEKGIDIVIEAMATLPGVHLTIVGTGPQEQELRSLISQLRLEDRITIERHVDDLPSFYHSLDVFVLPSRRNDPFGLVAAEALAAGIPTIVTDQCGIAGELMDHEDALIVEGGSSDALVKAVMALQKNNQLLHRLAEAGQKKAMRDFTADRMVERYEEALLRSRG